MLLPMLLALPATSTASEAKQPLRHNSAGPWKEEQDMRAHPCATPPDHQKPPLRSKDTRGWQRHSLCSERSRSPVLTTSLQPGWFHCEGKEGKEHPCRERCRAAGVARPRSGTGGGTGSDDRVGMFLTARSSSCLATITTDHNPATVSSAFQLEIKKKQKRKAAFRMPGAMQQFDSKS